jgi:hypothetical protein
MANKIRVVTLKANSNELVVNEEFEHSLENMQKSVGGYIEAITLSHDPKTDRMVTVWLNEEGKIRGLQPNFAMIQKSDNKLLDVIVGDVLITSTDEEGSTVGLTDEELELVKEQFNMNFGLITPVFVEKALFV